MSTRWLRFCDGAGISDSHELLPHWRLEKHIRLNSDGAVHILLRRRPDLVVLLVNTAPTGTAVVVGVDHASTILKDAYAEEEPYLLQPDPQTPPQEYVDRSIAIEPDVLLESPVWEKLVAIRDSGASSGPGPLWAELRSLVR
jgi:hypothetical protein